MDTNSIIESVRTKTWNALTQRFTVQTVKECVRECGRGESRVGYVPVSTTELNRIQAVHAVSGHDRIVLVHECHEASGMDAGEKDLFAYAVKAKEKPWVICSPDKASVVVAIRLGIRDRLWSLEAMMRLTGVIPRPELQKQFTEAWLTSFAAKAILDIGIRRS